MAASNADQQIGLQMAQENALIEKAILEEQLSTKPRNDETADWIANEICTLIGRSKETLGRFENNIVDDDIDSPVEGNQNEDDPSDNENREHTYSDDASSSGGLINPGQEAHGNFGLAIEAGPMPVTADDVLNLAFPDDKTELREKGEAKQKCVTRHC